MVKTMTQDVFLIHFALIILHSSFSIPLIRRIRSDSASMQLTVEMATMRNHGPHYKTGGVGMSLCRLRRKF